MQANNTTRFFVKAYGTLDSRSLALGRIALAMVLLLDLAGRAANVGNFYSNDGLLPNHTILWRPSSDHIFSPFFMASRSYEAAALFIFCGVAYVMLLVGYRTKLAQVLSWLCVLGLHGRLMFVQNGGDLVLVTLTMWTAFLPTGRAFSVDALSQRLRPTPTPTTPLPIQSLAVTALIIQLAAIYLFNALAKDGVTWRDGSVVHYVLHQDRIVTWFGVFLREHLTPTFSRGLTYTALGIEWTLPLALLFPVAQKYSRTIAVALVMALHLGFGLVMNLGIFVPVMLAFGLHFLPSEFWNHCASLRVVRDARNKALLHLGSAFLRRPQALQWLRSWSQTESQKDAGNLVVWREWLVMMLMLVAMGQLVTDNRVFRSFSHWRQPPLAQTVVDYLQFSQGWGMFAPEAPTEDFNVVVDATTADGRHVDPFNEAASPNAANPGFVSPFALGQNSLFCDYVVGIAHKGEYHQAFTEWVQKYPNRTGQENDRIVAFEAFIVTDDSPPLGETMPRNVRKESFLRWSETAKEGAPEPLAKAH